MNPWILCSPGFLLSLSLNTTSVYAAETPESLLTKARAVLAQLEGEVTVSGLKQPVEVLRDRWGVPHIYAKNADDLFFVQGFVVAQDRLFQIDMWRRIGLGETAEVLGKTGIDGDRFARLIRYRGDPDAEWASYSPDARKIAAAFTRGINAYIEHVGDRLPIEFQILKYLPKKWQPEDCLGRMSGIIMTNNFRNEIARAELVAAIGIEKARQKAPTDPIRAYGPAPELDLNGIDQAILAGYNAASRPWSFEVDPPKRGLSLFLKGTVPFLGGGSNNWAIDATLSASGKPMLASDPHRAISLPSLRYLVHLNAPGWNVIGSGEPGLPGVALGHNERVAWGFTIVGTDQADFYVEETHPQDATKYKVTDRWETMKVVREKINVRGEAQPVELELAFTRHGPVVHQDVKRQHAYVLKWVGSEPGAAAYLASLGLDRAKSARHFVEALRAWKSPGLNMVFADTDGNIGWVAAGLTPIRQGWDGLLPVPGASGKYEWQGFLPLKELPQTFNPDTHYVATANHNILPAGYQHEISYEWTPRYRFARIKQRLEGQKKFDLEDFKTIQHDHTSLPGQTLARLAKEIKVGAAEVNPRYLQLLAEWDGQLTRDSRAGPLYAVWLDELREEFFKPHVPKQLLNFVNTRGGIAVMLGALRKPDQTWFGEHPVEARDRLLQRTFVSASRKVEELLGKDAAKWSWGDLHTATFHHPLAGMGSAFEKAFNLGPVPRPGDGLTPNATTYNAKYQQLSGASYRHVLDLADWDRGLATSTPGQSGQPGSRHYGDLLPLWAAEQYVPLAFSRAKVEKVTQYQLLLKPGASD